jgi:hypothetical protein
MLSPRGIALQGIGFSPRLVSVQGLWPITVAPPVAPEVGSNYAPGARGSTDYRRPEITKRQRDDDDLALMLVQALYACGFFSED